MRLYRYLALLISITSILVLAGISWAKESPEAALSSTGEISSIYAERLNRIAEQKMETNSNMPMAEAVDKYMLSKKAEEEARNKMEKLAQESEASGGQSEQAQAEQILASLIAKNPILEGATVQVRECPNNWQGCVYYKSASIWIDPDHKASLEKIMVHECNHIIDWRTDGDIDNNDYHE